MRDDPAFPVLSVELLERGASALALLDVPLDVTSIARVAGGLPLRSEAEELLIVCPERFPFALPRVLVPHDRFVGQPNVLQGQELCIFLDPAREWHPDAGTSGFMQQLWRWLTDAAAGRHDPWQAHYHPVGGVRHFRPEAGTVVVREPIGWATGRHMVLPFVRRSCHRVDVGSIRQEATGRLRAARLTGPLHLGAGTNLRSFLNAIARLGAVELSALLTTVAATAKRTGRGSETLLLLGVPGSTTSVSPEDVHLLCVRLGPESVAWLRASGPLGPEPADAPDEPLEWLMVSDERTIVSTRRDHTRPVSALQGTSVEVWGCGGIGSWVAEYCVRAGADRIVLCDNGWVSRGLLVRQNYAELDVGDSKVKALARRLHEIHDGVVVEPVHGDVLARMDRTLPDVDVLIDATVSLAVANRMQRLWDRAEARPLVGRMVLDTATATLGMLQSSRPRRGPGPEQLDAQAEEHVRSDARLEAYEVFWNEAADEVLPERGCSVPTFHGSAADASAIAATMVSLLSRQLGGSSSGIHLVALPHTNVSVPGHVWFAALEGEEPQ